MNENFKGIWIPADLWRCRNLKLIEKLFLIEIKSLDNGEGCTAGNAYFAEFFDMTKSRCSQIIKSLEAKKMIKITLHRDGKLITKRVCNILHLGMYYFTQGMKNIKLGYVENAKENNTKENNNKEESFDKRINLNLPFDVVTSRETINAIFEDINEAIESIKSIYQIEATEEDIKTAMFTFSTVAIASYDSYKGIRTIEKLKNKFIEWIPKSIKFQSQRRESAKCDNSKPQSLDLESYIIEQYREVDLKYMKKDGRFERWEAQLKENSFRLSNIAKGYKNENFTTLFLFEALFMPLGKSLGGSNDRLKLESLERWLKTLSDYNLNKGDLRELLKEKNKKASL